MVSGTAAESTGAGHNGIFFCWVLMNYWDNLVSERLQWCSPCIDIYMSYGILYNWYVASKNGGTGAGSIAPSGWHVPTYTEYNTLLTFLDPATAGGISFVAGGYLKEAGLTHWGTPNTGADNSSGFTCLGSGIRANGFILTQTASYIWSVNQNGATEGWVLGCSHNSAEANIGGDFKWHGDSIRLIKDDDIDPGTMTDYDGNVYNTVKIGNQVWMQANIITTSFNDGTPIPEEQNDIAWAALVTPGYCWYNNTPS